MVLLKNEGGLLPLDKSKVKTLAIIGPDAYPGQPVGLGSAGVRPFYVVSFLEGVANYAGEGTKIMYSPGLPTLTEMADATKFVSATSGAGQPGLKSERFLSNDLSGSSAETVIDEHVNFGYVAFVFRRSFQISFHTLDGLLRC